MGKNIIRRILKEDRRQMYLDKIVQVMKNDFPLFKDLKLYGFYDQLSEDELIYVLSGVFGEPVSIHELTNRIYNDKNGNIIYSETPKFGHWSKWEYDENNNLIYYEDSKGKFWEKWEYNEDGKILYREYDTGHWKKWGYDENGKQIYYEDSDGLIRDYR